MMESEFQALIMENATDFLGENDLPSFKSYVDYLWKAAYSMNGQGVEKKIGIQFLSLEFHNTYNFSFYFSGIGAHCFTAVLNLVPEFYIDGKSPKSCPSSQTQEISWPKPAGTRMSEQEFYDFIMQNVTLDPTDKPYFKDYLSNLWNSARTMNGRNMNKKEGTNEKKLIVGEPI